MVYLNNIPVDTDFLSTSQSQIKENFYEINRQFSIDHDTLLATGATGKHLKVSFPVSAADPALITATDLDLYCKAVSGVTELFYRNSTGIHQLTSGGGAGFTKALVYFSSSGTIQGSAFNVSTVTRTATGQYTITFTTALADANYQVFISPDIPLGTPNILSVVTVSKAPGSVQVSSQLGGYADCGMSIEVTKV